jgi:uncharacterized membrane protein YjfL (UPF0719 family)
MHTAADAFATALAFSGGAMGIAAGLRGTASQRRVACFMMAGAAAVVVLIQLFP